MLHSKRTKYRKYQKGRAKGIDTRSTVHFGTYGIRALAPSRITEKQIEACRVAITRKVKRVGKVWIRIFPDKPITKKPLEVRMGSGKGSVEYWVALIQPGRMLFEVEGVPQELAKEAFALASAKLPVKTNFSTRTVM